LRTKGIKITNLFKEFSSPFLSYIDVSGGGEMAKRGAFPFCIANGTEHHSGIRVYPGLWTVIPPVRKVMNVRPWDIWWQALREGDAECCKNKSRSV